MERGAIRGTLLAVAEWAWPVWGVAGLFAYLAMGTALPMWLHRCHDSLVHVLLIDTGLHRPLSWGLLAGGLLGSAAAWLRDQRRRNRLALRLDLETLNTRGSQELEHWVCRALQARGYRVDAAGLGERDGGADLILSRCDGHRMLFQYRQWPRERVSALAVRELFGLMVHYRADSVRIVSLGGPDADAVLFADGKPIEFMSAGELLKMVKQARAGELERELGQALDESA